MANDATIKINATHSHTKTILAELRFHQSTLLAEVKEVLSKNSEPYQNT